MKKNIYKPITIVIGIIMLAGSCQNKSYEFPKAPEQVFLTEENMPPVEYFTLEKVGLPKGAQIDQRFNVYADTLLLTEQDKAPSPFMLSVYNLNTKELVAGYFTKGRGPGEMIAPSCVFRGSEVFVVDLALKRVAVLNIDSIAQLRYDYKPTIINTDRICTEYTRCVNDTLIGINDFHFYGFGYEQVPEFIKVSCADGKLPDNYSPKKMQGAGPANINSRISYFNNYTKQYVVAWCRFPYINIFDENFDLQKQYIGPDSYMTNLDEDAFGVLSKDTALTLYYNGGTQTDNNLLYVNYRKSGVNMDWAPDNIEIYCFDKSLNLVRRLKQKETTKAFLFNPSYCEKTGNLYFEARNNDSGELELYRCIFDK